MKIKFDFDGFWKRFDKKNNYFTNLLKKRFDICIDEKSPDYIIYSCFEQKKPVNQRSAVKIFFTGENLRVDFNLFDYGIGFDHLNFNDRYIRWPLYRLYGKKCKDGTLFESILNRQQQPENFINDKTEFCSFVFSNSKAHPIRELFFKRLSQYKKVDSGGRFLNNTGRPVKSKLDFIKKYKFNIAFENVSAPGYTTEKLIEAMSANTLPIYWGNPDITKEFNEESFIILKNELDIDKTIEKIIKLDQNDQLYMQMMQQPWILPKEQFHPSECDLLDFFENIFTQGPINSSRTQKNYGFDAIKWLNMLATNTNESNYVTKTASTKLLHKFKKLF